jgi:F-type H+-transporting ATPase subunit delta
MIGAQVAKKYGTALFQVARKANQVEEYFADLQAIREYVETDDTFLAFIRAPQIPDADKEAVIKLAYFDRVSRPVYEFLALLNRKRRLPHIVEIVDFYEQLYLEAIGVIKAQITTAVPLPSESLATLIGKLQGLTGKTVRADAEVDPAIIGGVIVVLHNQVIDQSLRYQLQLLKERLLALKVH